MAVAMDRSRFIIDVVASAFVREVERIIGKGIAKSYVERRFQEPPLPGRIDTAYHLGRWAGRPDKLATVAKRLTVDIPVNQAITIAARILRRAPLPLDLSSRLARIASCFRKVSHPPMSGEVVAAIRLSRLTSHYREALSLSEVIIRGDSIAPRHAVHSGTSIAFYMPKVWEDCVTRWVRSEWDPTFVCEPSYSFALTNGGEVSSLADVVVRDSSGIVALYDAKYKWPDATPSSEDIYQMVTYCERLRLTKATLCYPVHIEPRSVHVGNRTVNMVGLRQVRDSLKMIGLRAAAS
jgi:5-methylcytosine-specific restriction endonuclease McrBC regulatory subunit McrC